MSNYVFPAAPYDRARNMLALLGSHWSSTYKGNEFLANYLVGRAAEQAQSHLNLLETIAALSRHEVPVFHTDLWHLLLLRQTGNAARPLRYGDGAVYGPQANQTTYQYGGRLADGHRFLAPYGVRGVPLIFNRLTEPSVTLTHGVDFVLEGDLLTFADNPFENPLFPQTPVYEGTEVVDVEIGMWLFRGQFDWQHNYDHFAYMLGLQLASSEGYKAFTNALFDALGEGTSLKAFETAIAA